MQVEIKETHVYIIINLDGGSLLILLKRYDEIFYKNINNYYDKDKYPNQDVHHALLAELST